MERKKITNNEGLASGLVPINNPIMMEAIENNTSTEGNIKSETLNP
jgi:hypothetical protein